MADAPALGRVLSAIVTPMRADGSIDLDAAQRVATHLVDAGHDGLVVSGTTGSRPRRRRTRRTSCSAPSSRPSATAASIIAGAGSNDTAKSIESVRLAQKAGADAVLAVTPYYNKPPQAGLVAHFTALADASDLPVMVYDIPGRSGIAIARETYLRIAEHDRITAVKDARGDLWFAGEMMQADRPRLVLRRRRDEPRALRQRRRRLRRRHLPGRAAATARWPTPSLAGALGRRPGRAPPPRPRSSTPS